MYDQSIKGRKKMITAEKIGYGFSGLRKDGRVFCGEIVKVTESVKGTFVVVKDGTSHKSFYVHDLNGYDMTLSNGQPWWPSKSN
jgi:hypothetical protein